VTFARRYKAFTLIELVIVILLVSIVAISLGGLVTQSMRGYIDAKDRNRFSQSGKWVTERVSREVREALPQSVRTGINAGVHCVEFMNIVNASTSLDLPANGLVTSFNAVGFDLTFVPGLLLAIMPINPGSVYAGAGTLGNIGAITSAGVPPGSQVTITLSAPTTFARRSPRDRFYILDSPVSFCLNDNNGELRRYSNYAVNAAQPFSAPAGATDELMGENFSASGSVFNYQPGTLSRAGLLQINFRLQSRSRNLAANEEAFEVFHEVHVRNVP